MKTKLSATSVLSAALAVALVAIPEGASAQGGALRVSSEQTVGGFAWPESVAYDPAAKALYVSEFVSKLAPMQKDGMGRISKVALNGKVLERQFLPAKGGEALNKPKGIWVRGNRLWVTDIDVVWVFDLKTKKGRKLALPGAQFANDPTVAGNVLYVSDNVSDQLFKVEPADFLGAKGTPKVTSVFKGAGVNLYELSDGSLLVTDWGTGSLFHWNERSRRMQILATGFKGPADFAVVPSAGGLTVVVPDLVQSQLRFVQLRR